MLDLINRYAHGFVAIPTILACRERGLFVQLEERGAMTSRQLAQQLEANEGHLCVALRLFQSLGWLALREGAHYQLTSAARQALDVPNDVLDLFDFPFSSYVMGQVPSATLRPWIERVQARWHVSTPQLADFLDGMLVIPLLLALHKQNVFQKPEPLFATEQLSARAAREVSELFISLGWASQNLGQLQLTDVGRFVEIGRAHV